jgi:predicted Zn-dependent protease
MTGLLAAALAGCSENQTTGRRQLAFVPDEELARLADQSWEQLLMEAPVSRDPALHERLTRVATPIVRATGRSDLQWDFVVFDTPDLNAFVLPNGKVGVFRGMLEFVQSDDELAAVLGHEAAHILARHPAERVSQQLAAQAGVTLGRLVLGGENGQNADLVAGVLGLGATYGVLLPHSRSQELEADRIGVELMRKAGFEPEAAVQFWRRMMIRQSSQGGAPLEALSTHPADDRRLSELEAAIGRAPA